MGQLVNVKIARINSKLMMMTNNKNNIRDKDLEGLSIRTRKKMRWVMILVDTSTRKITIMKSYRKVWNSNNQISRKLISIDLLGRWAVENDLVTSSMAIYLLYR